MARVPTRDAFTVLPGGGGAGRVSANGAGQLAAVQGQSLQQVGQGLQRAGGAVFDMAEREQERINQARVREAALAFREDMAEAEREYQNYKGAELVAGDKPVMRDIEAKIEQRRNELITGLSSPYAQAAFEEASAEMASGWRIRAAQYEAEQADLYVEQQRDGMIQAQIETAIADPKKRGQSLQSANEVLREKFVDQGFDGERLDQKVSESMGELLGGQITVLLDADRIDDAQDVLDASKDMLSPAMASATQNTIDEKAFRRDVNLKADDVWDISEGEYGTAMKMAQMIDNPEMQEAVKQRLNTLKARDDQMRNWEKAQANAAKEGTKRVTDLSAYDEFYFKMETENPVEALNYLNSNVDKFSESDYRSLRAKVSNALDDANGPDAIESVRSVTNAANNALDRAGVKEDVRGELLQAYDQAAKQYQAENGSEPPDQWRDEKLEQLAAKIKVRKPGVFNDTTAGAFQFESVGFIPENRTQAVLAAFSNVDELTTISEAKLENAYSMAMAYFRLNGVSNPSDEALTEMIKAQQAQQ